MDSTPKGWWKRLGTFIVVGAVASSCDLSSLAHDERPIPNEVDHAPVQREAVAPALLPLIDSVGLFRFPVPNVAAREMPLDTALAQAREFLFYALNITVIRATAESQRGAFIDLGTLVKCSRPQLSRAPYERPPDSLTHSLQLQLGSRWFIPFCSARQTPEVIVSVATLGNSVRYQDGRSVGASENQNLAFQVRGIRWEWTVEHIVTAEEAVNEVYAVTGVRTARLPEVAHADKINGRPADQGGACPVWRVGLEQPVRFATVFSQRRLTVAEVFVTDSECPGVTGRTILLAPWAEQPATREIKATVRDSLSPTGYRTEVHLARLLTPVEFESVVIER